MEENGSGQPSRVGFSQADAVCVSVLGRMHAVVLAFPARPTLPVGLLSRTVAVCAVNPDTSNATGCHTNLPAATGGTTNSVDNHHGWQQVGAWLGLAASNVHSS